MVGLGTRLDPIMYSVNDLPAVSRKDCVGCSVEGGGSASRKSRINNVVRALSRPRYNWHIGVHTIRLHDEAMNYKKFIVD